MMKINDKNTDIVQKRQGGFTLIEIIVAVSIFVIVIMIAVGAVLNAVDANRKAQNTNVIIDNLNLSFESMIRDLRTGKNYSSSDGECASLEENTCVSFTDQDGNDVVVYRFNVGENRYIEKVADSSLQIGQGRITGAEVTLDEVIFNVQGDGGGNGPERILLNIKGSVGVGKIKSEFNLQTLITSRTLDGAEIPSS